MPQHKSSRKSPCTTSKRHCVLSEVAQKTTEAAHPSQDDKALYADGNIVVSRRRRHIGCTRASWPFSRKSSSACSSPWPGVDTGQVDSKDTFDGPPTIRVPDTAYDFKQFLLVVYDGFPREDDPHTIVDFALFAAWLRIGHKYQVQKLVIEALRGFRSIFPLDLGTWTHYHVHDHFCHPRIASDSSEAIEAINVIRQTGKVHLLPGALYTCAQLCPPILLGGTRRADGTPEQLSAEDLLLCLNLKERLRSVEAQIAAKWAAHHHNPARCRYLEGHAPLDFIPVDHSPGVSATLYHLLHHQVIDGCSSSMAAQTMDVDIRKDPDIWLEKGDAVIVCATTAFRIHEDVLCRHSRVFRDLCGGAKSGDTEDVAHLDVSGCIVLHVVDSAYDIKQLSHAFYDGISFLNPTEAAPFPVLAALTRMAYKYQLGALFAETTRRLRSVFTDSFEVWNERHGGSTELAIVEPGDAIEALNLFHLIGATDMLPAAFYMCTQLDLGTLLRGVLRADGSTPEILPDFYLECCLEAQDAFRVREVQIGQELSTLSATCPRLTHDQCQRHLHRMQEFMHNEYYFVTRSDPLGTDLSLRLDQYEANGELCDICVRFRKQELYRMQATLWEKLPSLAEFGATHVDAARKDQEGLFRRSICEAEDPLPLQTVTRDDDIWFGDGNVAIVAGSTAFRVHKGQLSRHSDVFDGLFCIPQTSGGDMGRSLGLSDSLDGCAVVSVSDTAFDFKHLLLALYDGARYLSPTGAVQFSVLAALARMAHKYQVDWLLAEATRRLKTALSDTFAMWSVFLSTRCVAMTAEDAVEAFNLFRRIGRTDMLPAALYACCQLDLSKLVHGVPRPGNGAVMEKLDVDDLERCLKARRDLKERNVKLALTLFREPPIPMCPNDGCGDMCGDCHSCDMEEYYLVADSDILGPHWSEYIEWLMEDDPAFCAGCAQMVKDKELEARLSAWRSLLGYAGIHVEVAAQADSATGGDGHE